jgi:hypothetical protein
MNKEQISVLREKILKGIEIAFDKLVQKKIRENGELVFSENGEIIVVKAKDLKNKLN